MRINETYGFVVIRLPRLTIVSALAVGADLLVAAEKDGNLPESVDRALGAMLVAYQGLLDGATARRVRRQLERAVADALQKERNAWRALQRFLKSLMDLPEEAAPGAETIYEALFSDGLGFLTGTQDSVFSAAAEQVCIIDVSYRDQIVGLGGGRILGVLDDAHVTYETAIRASETSGDGGESKNMQTNLRALVSQIRRYMLQIAAWVEDDPTVEVRARSLISPLEALVGNQSRDESKEGRG